MTSSKIMKDDISDIMISSLPTYPTSPKSYGGAGYTAFDMKLAFDRLPLYIIERFNALMDDISAVGEGSLADAIRTGITSDHTLAVLFTDITDGTLASYLDVGGASLAATLSELKARISALERSENTEVEENE